MENTGLKSGQTKMQEETEEPYGLIYELITDRFRLELQRINDLDGKASGIMGVVGIIVSLQAGLGGFLIKDVPRTCELYIPLCVLFLSGIILLTCSILCGFGAYYVREWKVVPETEYLIKEYGIKKRSRIDLLGAVSKEFSKATIYNREQNDKRIKFIKSGFMFLVLGIIFAILFISGLLLV